MLKIKLLAALASVFLTGHWEGAFERLGSTQAVSIDVTQDAHGNYGGTFDIPQLWLYDEPLTGVSFDGSTAHFHLLYGDFSTIYHPEALELTGVNAKWKPAINVDLKREVPVPRPIVRSLHITSSGTSIAGSLYLPHRCRACAAMIVIPGSGDQSRATWEYRGYAGWLSRQGIAAFVYDKRGLGSSSGSWHTAAMGDLAGDVIAIAKRLGHESGIDPKRIGVMGLSQGGWIAPLAASRHSQIAFVATIHGPAVSPQEQQEELVSGTVLSNGFSAADAASAVRLTQQQFAADYGQLDNAAFLASLQAAQAAPWAKGLDLQADSADDARWWRINRYDPAPALRALRVPVLAIFGGADINVPVDPNRALMRRYLASDRDVSIVVIPGMGHSPFTGQGVVGGDAFDWPAAYWRWDGRSYAFGETIESWLSQRGLNRDSAI